MLRRGLLAGLVGSVMLVVAAPAASAADNWDRPSQDFGSRNAGTKSDPAQFALVATCDAFTGPSLICTSPPNGVHSYGAITTTGPFAIDPATDACNAQGGVLLTPAASQPIAVCTLQVAFKPTSGGVKNGTLSTTTSPSGAPLSVALTGIGVATGKKTPGTTTPGQTTPKKCKKKGKKRSASAAKKKCKKKKK